MNHYNVDNKNDYDLIDTIKIEVDRIIGNTLYDLGIDFFNPKKTRGGIVSVNGRLSRMAQMVDSFNKNKELPPIKLKKHEIQLYIPPNLRKAGEISSRITYSILDGRHRVALSILNGYEKVPAIVINKNDF